MAGNAPPATFSQPLTADAWTKLPWESPKNYFWRHTFWSGQIKSGSVLSFAPESFAAGVEQAHPWGLWFSGSGAAFFSAFEAVAVLIALGSSLCTGFAMIGLHRLRDLDPRAIVVHFSATACLFSLGALFLFGSMPHPRPPFGP